MSQKSCNYVFTMNNYDEKPEFKAQLDSLPCKYMKYGKEVGESGTPHLQGLVVWHKEKTLSAAIKNLPGCHVEVMRSIQASLDYVAKEGDITERGIRPLTKKEQGIKGKEYYDNILQLAREDRIQEIDSHAQLTLGAAIRRERDEASKKRKLEDTEEQHLWYYGASGTGKSRKAREENPEAYLKMCNKWWDGYEDEEVVLIEDLDIKHEVLAHHLKIWGDRYPFLAEYKGGAKKIRPSQLIVTSNYHPSDIWTETSSLEPILRRFKCVKFLPNL